MHAPLVPLLEQLYSVAPKSAPPTLECSCCHDDERVDLTRLPLRELEPHVFCSFGVRRLGDDQLRYLLPRLLEFVTDGRWGHWHDEALQHELSSGRVMTWPAVEQAALAAFQAEDRIARVLELRVPEDGLLLTMADPQVLARLDSLLAGVQVAPTWFGEAWCALGRREGAWSPHEAMVGDWLLTHDAAAMLERAFFEAPDHWHQVHFSTALLVCEWFQR